jgi:hypothetical protein
MRLASIGQGVVLDRGVFSLPQIVFILHFPL